MPAKQVESRRKKPATSRILLRYRDADSEYGVSRETGDPPCANAGAQRNAGHPRRTRKIRASDAASI